MAETVFATPEEGEWVQPVRKGYLMQCCDCGLIHRLDFRLIKWRMGPTHVRHKIQFRAFRHEESA